MTLRHIRIFVAVCTYGSVTEASRKLYIAQPTVSLVIHELENYYGIKLFDRINRRLYLTPIGEQFLEYATHIMDTFESLETSMKNWDKVGLLRIGSSITIGQYFLSDYIVEFQKQHEHVKVNAVIDNSEKIEQLILKNQLDFALIEGVAHHHDIEQVEYMIDELVLLCHPEHPLSKKQELCVSDLKEEDFLLREKGSAVRDLFDSVMLMQGIEVKPIWQSVSTRAILYAVEKGLGITVLPYRLAEEEIKKKKVVVLHIKNVSFERNYTIIYHHNKFITPLMKNFFEIVKTSE